MMLENMIYNTHKLSLSPVLCISNYDMSYTPCMYLYVILYVILYVCWILYVILYVLLVFKLAQLSSTMTHGSAMSQDVSSIQA